ncbi:hypothetical protein BDV23DRAFT_181503 [Aspergillus alliaceus]|uniref:Uncharacterized protein n=1 Tax=Petromyces alliaceus TaxID=209559 RepID=A0A5N7CEM2_PETAA|nr:hypothetical protein BDV23DRAFT_181503 [Aspergillus alliaceus]
MPPSSTMPASSSVIESNSDQLTVGLVQRLLGTNPSDSPDLFQALGSQLVKTSSPDAAISAARQAPGLSSQDKAKLDTLLWIHQVSHGHLDLIDFCLANARVASQPVWPPGVVTPQTLAERIMTLPRDCKGVPDKAEWIHLRQRLFASASTSVIISLITSEQLPVRPEECKDHVVAVLQRARDSLGFDIGKQSVRPLLPSGDASEELFKGAGVPPGQYAAVATYLCSLQRLQALVNEPSDTGALIRCGFPSAEVIARNGPKRAKQKMVRRGVPRERVDQIFNMASLVAARNQYLCTKALAIRGTGSNRDVAIAGLQLSRPLYHATDKEDINFHTMFGLDTVSCEECASLTGPPAFFVDLLHRLSDMEADGGSNPKSLLDKLFERRPDLGELQLSCANSDVLVPYVDIVNEVLETVVWRLDQGMMPIISPFNASEQDTDQANLMQPQNTNFQVYSDVLQSAVSPMHTFPYNQAIHSLRAYFDALGVSYLELLEVFRSPYTISSRQDLSKDVDEALDHAAAAETLNLQREDYVAITRQGFYSRELVGELRGEPVDEKEYNASIGLQVPSQYWGFEEDSVMLDPEEGLARINDILLPRSGISIQDFLAIVRSQYTDEMLAIEILKDPKHDDPPASELLKNMRLRQWGPEDEMLPLDEEDCDRLQAFTRLFMKLQWPVEELDALLVTLSEEKDNISLTPTLLDKLAAVKQLAELTGRSPVALQPFWGDMNMHGDNSLFNQLFLSAVIPSKTRKKITPEVRGSGITSASAQRLTQDGEELVLTTVLMGLNLTPADFDAICKALGIMLPADLTLENISAVYRVSELCKILKVSPQDYPGLLLLLDEKNPFQDPPTTLSIIKEYLPQQQLAGAQWAHDRLLFMVKKISSRTDPDCQPTVDQHIRIIDAIQSGLDDPMLQDTEKKMQDATLLPNLVTELIPDVHVNTKVLALLERGLEDDGGDGGGDALGDDLTDEEFLTKALAPVLGEKRASFLSQEIMAKPAGIERVTLFLGAFLPQRYRKKQSQAVMTSLASFFPALSMPMLQFSLETLIQVDEHGEISSGMNVMLGLAETSRDDNPGASFSGYFRPPTTGTYLILSAADEKPEGAALEDTLLDFQEQAAGMEPKWAAVTDSLTGGRWYRLHYVGAVGELSWIAGDIDRSQGIRPAEFKPSELVSGTVVDRVAAVVVDLMRVSLLVDRFRSQSADAELGTVMQYVAAARGLPQQFSLNDLTTADIWALEQYVQLREAFALNGASASLLDLYKWLFSFAPARSGGRQPQDDVQKALAKKLSSASGWAKDDCLLYLRSRYPNASGFQLITWFQDVGTLHQMQTAIQFLRRLNLPSLSLKALFTMAQPAWRDLVATDFANAETLRLAIQSRRFPPSSSSPTALSQASDSIRTGQQRALIHTILADQYAADHGLTTPDQMFGHFLIDVQMGPGLQTSRITQAISSVQLFAQRCALGLEEDIGPEALDRSELDNILRYRLWEADRKAYLYPENWADPTLRDNKTEQFTALESKALQSKLELESIARIIKSYVHEVNAIGNLRVESYVIEHRNNGGEHLWFLFACSRTSPPRFYYRTVLVPAGTKSVRPLWSSWIPLTLDIPVLETDADGSQLGRPGSYVVPASYRSRVFVFLPDITLGQRRDTSLDDTKYGELQEKSPSDMSPRSFWEIRMGYSELRNGEWSPKTVCRSVIRVRVPRGEDPAPSVANFNFRVLYRSDPSKQLTILVEWTRRGKDFMGEPADVQHELGYFQLRGQEVVLVTEESGIPVSELDAKEELTNLKTTRTQFMRFKSKENSHKAEYYRQYGNADPPDRETVVMGRPSKMVEAGKCDWLVDASYPIEHTISTFIFEVAAQDRLEQFIDLEKLDSFRVDYMYNRVSPVLAEQAQQDQGLEGVYEVLKAIQPADQPADPSLATDSEDSHPHEDAFGRWIDTGNDNAVHYHERSAPYAIYNWELGVHIPMLLVERLMATQQFELALKVIRLVFDPSMDGEGIGRCWRFPPFREESVRNPGFTPDEPLAVHEWKLSGGNVHSAARANPVAYMKRIAVKYIELLLAMGDEHFRRDTLESLPLATQFYVEASHVFGPQPTELPQLGKRQTMTYNQLEEHLTALSNAIVDLELDFPFYVAPGDRDAGSPPGTNERPQSYLRTGYFCVPSNPQLLALRSQIDDRLYKIRNGMDISGRKRTLALLEPAIDPGAVQAARGPGGAGIAGFLNDLESPMPRYRFRALIGFAYDLCSELKGAASQKLGYVEARDGEALSLLKSRHQRAVLALTMRAKEQQMAEISRAIEVQQLTRRQQETKLAHYLALTGDNESKEIPARGAEWQNIPLRIEKPSNDDFRVSPFEREAMRQAELSADLQWQVALTEGAARIAFALPQIGGKMQPIGAGADLTAGGEQIGNALKAYAAVNAKLAEKADRDSAMATTKATAIQQLQERRLEANDLGQELMRIDKEIAALEAQIDTFHAEIDAQKAEIENARVEEEWLRTKYAGHELFTLLDNAMGTLLHRTYSMAMEFAKVAQRALSFELALRSTSGGSFSEAPSILATDYWETARDGQLSGEALWLDLKRLEAVDRDSSRYDYEMTKVVSLRETDPMALLSLLELGEAQFELPELLFDMDYPGHFCRRIVSVAVSLSNVPLTPTNLGCTLTLQQHKYRTSHSSDAYADQPAANFRTDRIPITSIAVTDSVRDTGDRSRTVDQYAPFEGAGAVSSWRISFPTNLRRFDYGELTDVVLHVRYTAFSSGGLLEQAASTAVAEWTTAGKGKSKPYYGGTPKILAINLADEYPDEWEAFLQSGEMQLPRINDKLPFWARKVAKSSNATLYITPKLNHNPTIETSADQKEPSKPAPSSDFGEYTTYEFSWPPASIVNWTIKLTPEDAMSTRRAWLLVDYSGTA